MNVELQWDVTDRRELNRLDRNLSSCIVLHILLLKPGLEGEKLDLAI
jgi:hypothetical protein